MGFISGLFGTQNSFQAGAGAQGNPYTAQQLQEQYAAAQANQANQAALQGQQGALGQQLLAQSQGQGPNPSLSQLQATTNANNQQQAGLLASQRGLNPALAAKMAATNQSQNNQQSANQAATLRAQQQLAAQGQLQHLYGQQGQEYAQQGSNINQQQGLINQANLGTQAINANVAGQNAAANGQAAGAGLGALGSVFSMFGSSGGGGAAADAAPITEVAAKGGMIGAKRMAEGGTVSNPYMDIVASAAGLSPSITNAGNIQSSGASQKAGAMKAVSGVGSLFAGNNTGGSEAGAPSDTLGAADLSPTTNVAAKGGMIRKFADGGSTININGGGLSGNPTGQPTTFVPTGTTATPASSGSGWGGWDSIQQGLGTLGQVGIPLGMNILAGPLGGLAAGQAMKGGFGSGPGQLPTLSKHAQGGPIAKTDTGSKLKAGGGVPGKASVKGNSYSNDTVKALLSPGEVVIPRSVMQSEDPAGNAAKFVMAVMSKQGLKGAKPKGSKS